MEADYPNAKTMHTIWKQTKFLNRIDTPATIQGWCWAQIMIIQLTLIVRGSQLHI